MNELKPCPFCGSSASVSTVDDEACSSHDVVPWYAAGCHQCGAHMEWDSDKAEAIAAWNTRQTQGGQGK